ncbi:MAG: ABC transporter [Tepidiforma sp.]|nr:ABC transporter ATP-binding protein [Tepidiforma sp.]GIW18850.1 MAG: ABC transporter [Tepidiforma sp.]
MAEPAAIATHDLTRTFGETVALEGLDLRVERGEIFGFLGANGAGKTTTIRLLLDLIRPTRGEARVLGFDCQRDSLEVRRRIGYLPGELRLYPGLTGEQTAAYFAALRDGAVDRAYMDELARRLELDLSQKAGSLSKGTRQKLGLLLALMAQPPVLLLDEPTSGLDPIVQHTAWELLREAAARGTTVFFSSHVLSEVEQVCERVAVLKRGRLVALDTVAGLKERAVRHCEVTFADDAPPPGAVAGPGVREIRRERRVIEFEVTGEFDPLLKALAAFRVADLRTSAPTLEEIVREYYEEGGP